MLESSAKKTNELHFNEKENEKIENENVLVMPLIL